MKKSDKSIQLKSSNDYYITDGSVVHGMTYDAGRFRPGRINALGHELYCGLARWTRGEILTRTNVKSEDEYRMCEICFSEDEDLGSIVEDQLDFRLFNVTYDGVVLQAEVFHVDGDWCDSCGSVFSLMVVDGGGDNEARGCPQCFLLDPLLTKIEPVEVAK
jgi:hypothetical protein